MKLISILIILLALTGITIPYLSAYYFSVNYNVPYWYLYPRLIPLSGIPIDKTMKIDISPTAPLNLGEQINVVVKDYNNTCIDGVNVIISKDGNKLIEKQSNELGVVTFEYPGMVTILTFEKEGYKTEMKVIPRIPDDWVLVKQNNDKATLLSLTSISVALLGIVLSQRKDIFKIWKQKNRSSKKKTKI